MYVHANQLGHLLKPEHYCGEPHYRAEMERLFLPGWHPVATRPELARAGDFVTLELLGQPLQLRNFDGEVHAFENVCAHRHCLLTHRRAGNDPHFRCQYHGWEYTREGRTGRIPDAGCFRPFDRENARLRKFRAETCGDLVFVRLAEDGPELADYLGPYYRACTEFFAPPFQPAWKYEADYQANWKVPVENTLEAYHIPCLHRKTFGQKPTEENSEHELNERYSFLRTPEPPTLARVMQNWMVRRLGVTPTNYYLHYMLHPNLTFISTDVLRLLQVFLPTSATTSHHLVLLYTLRGTRRGPGKYLIGRLLARLAAWVTRMIVSEDVPIFADVQRGLCHSTHPGVIGTLEERIHVFQDYVLRMTKPY
jgi:phenylpropionate dioxygenase-like ring-hydroxylating dioxygenase large terminal subunit